MGDMGRGKGRKVREGERRGDGKIVGSERGGESEQSGKGTEGVE